MQSTIFAAQSAHLPSCRRTNTRINTSVRSVAGRRMQKVVSNGSKTRAFFGSKREEPSNSTIGLYGRDDYTREEVEDYFNYMGMLAAEGNYDRLEAMIASGVESVDLLLLMACSENDTPKVEELMSSGANPNVKDLNGKTAYDLATKDEVKELLDTYKGVN